MDYNSGVWIIELEKNAKEKKRKPITFAKNHVCPLGQPRFLA